MGTQTDDEAWSDPRQSTHSFWDPGGPFRPVRRFSMYAAGLGLVLLVVAGLFQQVGLALLLGSGVSTMATIWLACWVVDTILAYLKR